MNPRVLQKQLLLLEAEVRRRQLSADWEVTRSQLQVGMGQARKLGTFAATAAVGWTAVNLFRGRARPTDRGRSPRLRLLLSGLKLAMAAWPAWKAIRDRAAANRR